MQLDDLNLNVSRETYDGIDYFERLVRKWTAKINLISPNTVKDMWLRHIIDSAQIYQYAPQGFQTWVDFGSGGGFPGVIIGILAKELNPGAVITLVESDHRKATFLRTAARELNLNISVTTQRIEQLKKKRTDIVSARALMSLDSLMPHLQEHLAERGVAIIHKGRRADLEISAAQQHWAFELHRYPSITDTDARILTLRGITRA